MSDGITFARNLVKGRIAETIFAQMYRETDRFTVLEFGYEKIIPELIQHGYQENNVMIETLRTAPDFAVIDQLNKEVKLIEVKYRRQMKASEILSTAKRMSESWNPSYLFIATLEGFYFDSIRDVIENEGEITPLDDRIIASSVQKNYIKILQDFESNN